MEEVEQFLTWYVYHSCMQQTTFLIFSLVHHVVYYLVIIGFVSSGWAEQTNQDKILDKGYRYRRSFIDILDDLFCSLEMLRLYFHRQIFNVFAILRHARSLYCI